jgi:hypothetical protein
LSWAVVIQNEKKSLCGCHNWQEKLGAAGQENGGVNGVADVLN